MEYKACPYCFGQIKKEAIKCKHCRSLLKREHSFTQWYRSREGRKIAGVCQGLSKHFDIPVTLIRLFFIMATLIGGWGVFIYLYLCLMPLESSQKEPLKKKKTSPILKFIHYVILIIFSICIYIPFGISLLLGLFFSIWSFGYPIIEIDIFRFCLIDLGVPGIIMGLAICFILLQFIYILFSLILHLHFSKKILWGSFAIHFIIFSLLSTLALSSFGVSYYKKSNFLKKTWTDEITLSHNDFTLSITKDDLLGLCFPIRTVELRTSKQKNIRVVYTIIGRGGNYRNLVSFMEQIIPKRSKNKIFPSIWKPSNRFPFSEIRLRIVFPESMALKIKDYSGITIDMRGDFETIHIDSEFSTFQMKEVKSKWCTINMKSGSIYLEDSEFDRFQIYGKNTDITSYESKFNALNIKGKYLRNFFNRSKWNHLKFRNTRGYSRLRTCEGVLTIQDKFGTVNLYRHTFPLKSKNSFVIDIGKLILKLRRGILPKINIENHESYIQNEKANISPNYNAYVGINVDNGSLSISD